MTGEATEPDRPLVSVIIPAVNGWPILAECLGSLAALGGRGRLEALVVTRDDETSQAVRDKFPDVRVIPAAARASIPAMRALAVEQAAGRFIAFTEDHCLVQPHWLEAVERAAAGGRSAVGGPVENACVDRVVDWAAFFCEYVRFMPPMPAGPVAEIPGNNSAYDRRLFDHLREELRAEVWESFLFDRLRQLGVEFYSDPDMAVRHKKSFGFGYFLSQRYHYSRSFAGMRLRGRPGWKRAAYAGAAVLVLPGLIFARIAAAAARKRRHGRQFLASLPVLGVFLIGWGIGEMVGALFGPGRSLERVE